jgi:hypothetical protein
MARNLGPDQIKGLEGNSAIRIHLAPKGGNFYLGLNQRKKSPASPRPARR